MPDEMMTIGSYSLMTGLSIPTLRHYDDIGLLQPMRVDTRTSYRRYGYSQVELGRRTRLLRDAGLSRAQIARVINGGGEDLAAVLAERRADLERRTERVRLVLDQLRQDDIDGGMTMTTATDFRLVAVNIGVDSDSALNVARAFWGRVLGTDLEDWGSGSQQVVLGHGDNIGFLNIRVRSADEPHHGHTAAFGLGVPDLDGTHERAIAAGAKEHYAPTDGENMPRHSRIVDPVGNRVVLWESGQ